MENTAAAQVSTDASNSTTGDELDKLKADFFHEIDQIISELKAKEPWLKFNIAELQEKKKQREDFLRDLEVANGAVHSGPSE